MTDRIEAAANAVMRSELVPLTSDLPATAAVGVVTQSAGVRGVGDVKRSGPWIVPAENSFRTWFGHIKLDLRQAQISATETHIHARALFGNVDLLVPEGVEVEVQARTQVGRTDLQAGSAMAGAPRIVLTGGTFFGDIKVRHRRLWRRWRAAADSPSSAGLERLGECASFLRARRSCLQTVRATLRRGDHGRSLARAVGRVAMPEAVRLGLPARPAGDEILAALVLVAVLLTGSP